MKNKLDLNKQLGVYDAPIFKEESGKYGVHYLIKHFLFFYVIWLLKDDLNSFMRNVKETNITGTKYIPESNKFVYPSYQYQKILQNFAHSVNGDSVIELIRFAIILMRPYNQSYIMNLDDLTKFISDSETSFKYELFKEHLDAFSLEHV